MKRKLAVLSTIIFALFTLTGISQAQGINLKLFGGYGMMTTGDYNTFAEDQNSYFRDLAALGGATTEGEFEKLKMGFEYGGEIIVKLVGGIGIGVGAGYIQRSNESEMTISLPLVGSMTMSSKPDFNAIPVTLSLYYFLPSPPLVNIYLNGGVGYYFGKIKGTTRIDIEQVGFPSVWSESIGEMRDQGLGFHGGVGLEFNMGSNIGLFVEGRGRYCKLKSWEGDETYKDSFGFTDEVKDATVWYYEVQDVDTLKWYSQFVLSEDKPDWSGIREVRKFEVDLTGISVRVGIRIKF